MQIINKKGYTLGMTLLITSVVLFLTMSIYSLIFAQFRISDIGDQSAKAYYNADLGIECVKYLEGRYPNKGDNPNSRVGDTIFGANGFFLPVDSTWANPTYNANTYRQGFQCANSQVTAATLNATNFNNAGVGVYSNNVPNMIGNYMLTSFTLRNLDKDICVDVKVYKTIDNDDALAIISRGYNTCNQINGARIAREVIYQKGYVN